MLSRAHLHSHHSFNGYTPSPERLSGQHHLPPALKQHDHHAVNDEDGNLQAGRKRRESDMDPMNDSGESGNVKRRISRACDQCNQLRTKCDGKNPCAHCSEIGLTCEYARAHKKRGRAPRRVQEGQPEEHNLSSKAMAMDNQISPASARKYSSTSYMNTYSNRDQPLSTNSTPTDGTFEIAPRPTYYNSYSGHSALAMNDTATMVPIAQQHFANPTSYPANGLDSMQQGFGFPLGDDYSVAFMGKAPMVESPDWMALTTPVSMQEPPFIAARPRSVENLRYPVLRPLSSHIEPIMPQALACDLLEQYFASSTSAFLRPSNPYVLGHIFRKHSILHPTDPRPCTPALLASMLWISAQVSDAALLTSQVDARGKVCQKLLELTINMLNPLIHNSSGIVIGTAGYNTGAQTDADLASLVVSTDHNGNNQACRGQIDNLATYIHLATVVSASERKAASLRWWNVAWSLARELRLGREFPEETVDDQSKSATGNHAAGETVNRKTSSSDNSNQPGARLKPVTEEEREERRRAWWLLYMQDRHLALCYNRPMFFLNKECEGLLQPLDDDVWQSARFETALSKNRKRGLNIECTSHSVFGYFLPLMVILGEILDLNHARNRPRFGPKARQPRNWDDRVDEIIQQLGIYGQSLQDFEQSHNRGLEHNLSDAVTPFVASSGIEQGSAELSLQTKTVVSYGTHILNVLHILLTGKWDPIALLDDNDFWLSSQSFVSATGHAVSAAEAVADIIEHDPDLSFMPFFFGIYLLQGSFLLLLFAEKLQGDVSADVVKACETIVRAHEASIATLSTQYQLNFRKVMRSALQQVRGRIREDATEQQQKWRREILKLYRWTGDGTGLAL